MTITLEEVERQKLIETLTSLDVENRRALGKIDSLRVASVVIGNEIVWLPMDPSKILDCICNMVGEATGHFTTWKVTSNGSIIDVFISHPGRDFPPFPRVSGGNFHLAALNAYAESCKIERSNKEF